MTHQEIREYVDAQYKLLESIDVTTFVLNDKVALINEDIYNCQHECEHEFVDGVCKWCDAVEE